jgi:hypothetical protein
MNPSFIAGCAIDEDDMRTRPVRGHAGATGKLPPYDLIFARRALDQGRLEEAAGLIRRAMSLEPGSAEAWSLMGALFDRLGECHVASHCLRTALGLDPHDTIALAGLRRYRERFRLDIRDPAINPAAQGYPTVSLNSEPSR